MEKYEYGCEQQFSDYFLNDTDKWSDLKKVYFYALSLTLAQRAFEQQPELDNLTHFGKFAYDVVEDYLNNADYKKLQNSLTTARTSLNRLLAETEEDNCNCERMKNGAFLVRVVMHEAIVLSIDYIDGADTNVLSRELSSIKLNPNDITTLSPSIENYATIMENLAIDSLNEREEDFNMGSEECLMEDILTPAPNFKERKTDPLEYKPSKSICFTIPAIAYFYESKDYKHYYKNKIRKMYDAVETTEMTEDDYTAIGWCISSWNWYAAKLFSEGKLDVACSIVYAVLTETVKGFSKGKLLEKLTSDLDYERNIGMRIYDTRTLFSHFLRDCTKRYLSRIYTTFMNMEEDPSLKAFHLLEMSSVSRAAARELDLDY